MMIKETSLRRDPDLRGELAFLARGCDFVLPSRFKKRLKSFQQAQVSEISPRRFLSGRDRCRRASAHMPSKTNYLEADTNRSNNSIEGLEYSVRMNLAGDLEQERGSGNLGEGGGWTSVTAVGFNTYCTHGFFYLTLSIS